MLPKQRFMGSFIYSWKKKLEILLKSMLFSLFAKIVKGFLPLIFFTKNSFLSFQVGSKYFFLNKNKFLYIEIFGI